MKKCVSLVALAGFAVAANASVIPDRSTLQSILGGGGTLEDFETLDVPQNGQIFDSSGLLNSTSTFAGFGPGLVEPGVDYRSASFWWNGNGYFNLNTRTLGDGSGWRGFAITMEYTQNTTAMGIDMQGYEGYSVAGTASVYDTSNNLIEVVNVNGGFFGYEHGAGIGSVVVSADIDGYIMIDNHEYGVPAPSTALALALVGVGGALRRRR